MTGRFKVDSSKLRHFSKMILIRLLKIVVPVWALMVFFVLWESNMPGAQMAVLVAVSTVYLTIVVVIGMVKAEEKFRTTKIILEDNRVLRLGEGLSATIINYREIGRVVRLSHGIVIVRKGFLPLLRYALYQYSLTSDSDVIFVPCMMKDYDLLKEYFLK